LGRGRDRKERVERHKGKQGGKEEEKERGRSGRKRRGREEEMGLRPRNI